MLTVYEDHDMFHFPIGGGVDYDSLVAGSLGTDVFLDRNNQRMCITINLVDDALDERRESLRVRVNLNPLLGTVIDGNFRFSPNITEVIIEDLEGIIILVHASSMSHDQHCLKIMLFLLSFPHHMLFIIMNEVTRTIQTISE